MFIKRKREVVLKGANAEIGAHIDNIKHMPIYLATGPYYLHGKGKTSWGAELRAAIDFFDYVRLEGNSSYDSLFGWIGQGQISLNLPLGRKKALKLHKNNSCSQERILRCRALQRIDRNEIIPVDNQHKKFVAINPVTHTPFTFWFVKNTSSSDGTFESPFPLLLRAQASSVPNDIIYVFKGDGTSRGMDNGLTLQDNQLLLGSGNKHSLHTTLGKITIPAFTSGMPLVTTSGANVITLANHNTISGIHIDNGSTSGVFGSSVRDVTLQNNLFTSNSAQTSVNLINTSGKIAIKKNVFLTSAIPNSMPPNANGISVDNTNVIAALSIRNNFFQNQGGFGTLIVMKGSSKHLIDIRDNTFIAPIGFESEQLVIFPPPFPGTTPIGIGISGVDTSAALVSIVNNRCLHHELDGISIETDNNAFIHSSIISNVIHPGTLVPIVGSGASAGIALEMFGNSVQTSLISSNVVTASKSFGIAFANIGTASCSVKIANNSVSGGGQSVGTTFFGGGIGVVVENAGNLTAEIANNVLERNLSTGGFLGMNLYIGLAPSNGILCVNMHNNTSDTGYLLYNPDTGAGSPTIQLEEGYQTNKGTINGVTPRVPSIPPAPIPPGSPFPLPGGPIILVPQGFCP
jgi:hypothetical protein